eukprot:1456923-Alexandrium_andersonii.AAC.1
MAQHCLRVARLTHPPRLGTLLTARRVGPREPDALDGWPVVALRVETGVPYARERPLLAIGGR